MELDVNWDGMMRESSSVFMTSVPGNYIHYQVIAEPKGEATNRDASSFRVCIYVCMYVCIYVCISVTVNSGHFDCVTATDARQRE